MANDQAKKFDDLSLVIEDLPLSIILNRIIEEKAGTIADESDAVNRLKHAKIMVLLAKLAVDLQKLEYPQPKGK